MEANVPVSLQVSEIDGYRVSITFPSDVIHLDSMNFVEGL